MRTLATAMTLALAAGSATAGVVYSEDFNTGTLGSFTYQDYKTDQPSAFKWLTNEDLSMGNFTGGSGAAAMSSSDEVAGPYDHAIISPSIELPKGTITMSFLTNYQNYSHIDFADVDVTNDNGANWYNMIRYNEDHGAFYSTPGESAQIDLSQFAGDTIQVRFHHYDNERDAFDWYWQVDNISVQADAIPAPGAIGLLGAAGLAAARRRR